MNNKKSNKHKSSKYKLNKNNLNKPNPALKEISENRGVPLATIQKDVEEAISDAYNSGNEHIRSRPDGSKPTMDEIVAFVLKELHSQK